ncbi:hypothetical protein HRW07_20020 [Streptomyces lunaelactis]|uniref:hypothetical protein n=1 Tax=Streptomyces lunaelactis TaxID=1535768 RepID=UPI001585185C|nr:hypothetical protein [Streptomyces lunaelactis]NUL05479.1 hypothetical protein [Streptomyces lunaelactis]
MWKQGRSVAGVWTEEVGTITGELELRTLCTDDGSLIVRVRYAGALDWYSVRGGQAQLYDPRDHQTVHELLVNVLHYPGG